MVGINVGTYVQSRGTAPHQLAITKGVGEAIANTGVAATAFAGAVKTFQTAQILGGVGALRELQERLKTAGHYSGPIDGNYGPALKTAIATFEAGGRLPPTGLASEDVLSRLRLLQTSGPAKR